jgi:ribose transport system substrate-binding protein
MRKVAVLFSVLMVVVLLAGCVAPTAAPAPSQPAATTAPAAAAAAKPYIPVISKGFQHQFWQAVKLGSENAAKEFNVDITFEGPGSESEVDKQIEMLQTALDKNPAAICFAALDSKAAIPLLEKAKAANIPVVAFDSGVDSDIPVSTATTDNVAAAAAAADKMAELIGGKGEVVDQIAAKYPDIKVVNVDYGAGDPLKSTEIVKAVIQANPNLKGYFGANEGSMKGVMNGVKETGKEGKIVMIGYDAGKQLKDEIRSGVVAGAISQDPVGIGYKCVEAAVKALKGETLPKIIDTGYKWYDKTNIDAPEMQPLLYD